MSRDKALSLLGIAQKAGRVSSGEFAAEQLIRSNKAALVILSEDASDNTKKKFRGMAQSRELPVRLLSDKAELGRRLGRGERSVLAVSDAGLVAAILEQLAEETRKRERSVLDFGKDQDS